MSPAQGLARAEGATAPPAVAERCLARLRELAPALDEKHLSQALVALGWLCRGPDGAERGRAPLGASEHVLNDAGAEAGTAVGVLAPAVPAGPDHHSFLHSPSRAARARARGGADGAWALEAPGAVAALAALRGATVALAPTMEARDLVRPPPPCCPTPTAPCYGAKRGAAPPPVSSCCAALTLAAPVPCPGHGVLGLGVARPPAGPAVPPRDAPPAAWRVRARHVPSTRARARAAAAQGAPGAAPFVRNCLAKRTPLVFVRRTAARPSWRRCSAASAPAQPPPSIRASHPTCVLKNEGSLHEPMRAPRPATPSACARRA